MLIVLASLLLSCASGKAPENLKCPPEEPYNPSGQIVDVGQACEVDSGQAGCLFYCSDAAFCAGVEGAVYCENCNDLDAYVTGPCADCSQNMYYGTALWLVCPQYM